jgi:hypothetical protein
MKIGSSTNLLRVLLSLREAQEWATRPPVCGRAFGQVSLQPGSPILDGFLVFGHLSKKGSMAREEGNPSHESSERKPQERSRKESQGDPQKERLRKPPKGWRCYSGLPGQRKDVGPVLVDRRHSRWPPTRRRSWRPAAVVLVGAFISLIYIACLSGRLTAVENH